MPTLRDKIEEQNRLWARMQEIRRAADEEGRDWTAEERANWDAADDKITEVSADIERLERMAKLESVDYDQVLERQQHRDPDTETTSGDEGRAQAYDEAFNRYVRGGLEDLKPEQRQLMAEHRAQGEGIPAAGGYLVPDGFRQTMTETMKAFGGVLNFANVITTSTGNTLQWPTNDSTSQVGSILAENTQITELDVTFGTKAVGAYTYTSRLVRVSLQLLADDAFNLETWLPRKLGERIGRAVADDLVNGTGIAEPTGLLPTSTQGATETWANWSNYDGGFGYTALLDLEHSIDPAYRNAGSVRFFMSDLTLKQVRKMVDTTLRPIYLPVPTPGFPATINGYPYTVDQALVEGAAATKPIVFGDLNAGFLVRQVQGVQMVRLAERYADYLQVGFFGFSRLDSTPDDTAAYKHLALT